MQFTEGQSSLSVPVLWCTWIGAKYRRGVKLLKGLKNSGPRKLLFSEINIVINIRKIFMYTCPEGPCHCYEHRPSPEAFVPFSVEINEQENSSKIKKRTLEWSGTITSCCFKVWLWLVSAAFPTVGFFSLLGFHLFELLIHLPLVQQHALLLNVLHQAHPAFPLTVPLLFFVAG